MKNIIKFKYDFKHYINMVRFSKDKYIEIVYKYSSIVKEKYNVYKKNMFDKFVRFKEKYKGYKKNMFDKFVRFKWKVKNYRNKIIHKSIRMKDILKNFILSMISFVVNIEITPLFLLMASYAIGYEYPLKYRFIGAIGVYVIYKMLLSDIKSVVKEIK